MFHPIKKLRTKWHLICTPYSAITRPLPICKLINLTIKYSHMPLINLTRQQEEIRHSCADVLLHSTDGRGPRAVSPTSLLDEAAAVAVVRVVSSNSTATVSSTFNSSPYATSPKSSGRDHHQLIRCKERGVRGAATHSVWESVAR